MVGNGGNRRSESANGSGGLGWRWKQSSGAILTRWCSGRRVAWSSEAGGGGFTTLQWRIGSAMWARFLARGNSGVGGNERGDTGKGFYRLREGKPWPGMAATISEVGRQRGVAAARPAPFLWDERGSLVEEVEGSRSTLSVASAGGGIERERRRHGAAMAAC